MSNVGLVNFTGGVFTPQIDCRSDVEKYSSGCRQLENFLPRIYGGVERRPGTKHIYNSQLWTLTLDSSPAPAAFSFGATLTGAESGTTCRVIEVTSSTEYVITNLDGDFTDGEIISDGTNSRDCGANYPLVSLNEAETVRIISFIYSSTISYKIELGNKYMRFFYEDEVLVDGSDLEVLVETPYLTAHLFQLHIKQLADTMWIIHPSYAPRKLTRTTTTSFSLDAIEFKKGPFLTRNDLLDPDVTDTATMASSKTAAGETGTLTCSNDYFVDEHIGSIFELTHPREDTISKGSISDNGTVCDAIDVKGTFHFVIQGTWKATVALQRNENSAGWENYRTYTYNVQYSGEEEADNVQYRAVVSERESGKIKADITVDEAVTKGIVKVTDVNSATEAAIEVVVELESTDATKRWAEGAWSPLRGYPSSVTFFEDRCIYGGTVQVPTQILDAEE